MDFSITFFQLFFWGLVLGAPILLVLCFLISGLGLIVGRIEHWKPFDAFYWAYITALTIGYGDMRPTQKSSRVLSIMIGWCGIMFTGLLVAIAVKTASTAFEMHINPELMQHISQRIHHG